MCSKRIMPPEDASAIRHNLKAGQGLGGRLAWRSRRLGGAPRYLEVLALAGAEEWVIQDQDETIWLLLKRVSAIAGCLLCQGDCHRKRYCTL